MMVLYKYMIPAQVQTVVNAVQPNRMNMVSLLGVVLPSGRQPFYRHLALSRVKSARRRPGRCCAN